MVSSLSLSLHLLQCPVDVTVYENQLQIDSGNGSPNDIDLNSSIIGGQSGNYMVFQADPQTEFELNIMIFQSSVRSSLVMILKLLMFSLTQLRFPLFRNW